jgi:hypothetical protein
VKPLYLFEVQKSPGAIEYVVSVLDPSSREDIPAEAIVGTTDQPFLNKVTNIAANPLFTQFMHAIIQAHAPRVPNMLMEAKKQRNGIIFVIDRRVCDVYGAIAPEDIIGAFEVRESFIHPETYRANSQHRLITDKGFFQLDCILENELRTQLARK